MRTKFKAWTKPYIDEHQEVMVSLPYFQDAEDLFALEIGSGKGQFLLDMAKKFPHKEFVGIERNVTCAGISAKKLVDEKINNAKLAYENADAVLDSLKDNSVNNIFLNFSDPWPKKRHEKRRLTAPSYLAKYFRVLKKCGRLLIKTDNVDLFHFTLENMANTSFIFVNLTENYIDLDDFDTFTEYELSFRKEGKPIYRLVVEKK